ncbi:MAG: RHS repeat-associated core domain-containing protein, partial [Saprospiraceae bacterium]
LPYRIIGEENDTLFFTYNAGGTLLQKKYIRDSLVIDKVDYLGNIEIRDSNVILYHEDGRIRKVGSTWKYDYYIKDNLGNIRVVFEDIDGNEIISPEEIKARYDYYSFGMMHAGNGLGYLAIDQKENFGYNGKELAEEMNADLLLYGARQMDGTLGRFLVPDMMAEAKPDMNPYRYGFNSLMNYIDPVGLFESKKAARAYAREHGIYTGWFGRNKIVENSDGSYSIDNRKRHSSVRDYGTGIGIVEGAIAETRGVHLRDIGTEGMAALNDIGSERYNPDAYVVTGPLDIAYAAGVYVGLASASGRIFKGAGIVNELPKIGLTNAELVQRAATFADDFVPFTKNAGATGTLKHEAATNLLKRYQNLYGYKG